MTLTRLSLAAALVLSLASPLALASRAVQTGIVPATAEAPAQKTWVDLDGNRDGKLTPAEAAAAPSLGSAFGQADRNADGTLTGDEYRAYVDAQAKAADANK